MKPHQEASDTQTIQSPSSKIAALITTASPRHSNDSPLWQGPCGDGWNGGITQSMIGKFLSCRERFRLRYVLGLENHDKWNHRMGYGNMWHVCEEAHAKNQDWIGELADHFIQQANRYPFQQEEINKWSNVCMTQFPEYINYWSEHPDVKNRTPLLQEQVFDVPYTIPSGRVVRLRGRWDSVDLIDDGIYIQENKTKSDIDKVQIERQMKFDLQTMLYLVALQEGAVSSYLIQQGKYRGDRQAPIKGVRYNVIRRPLSGGKGNISPHKAKSTKTKYIPAETQEQFYERLRLDYFVKEPEYWFFRLKVEITPQDIEVFRKTCLDPLLECICDWYSYTVGDKEFATACYRTGHGLHYVTPFGIYNSLQEGGATEYDSYLETGSEAGLRRTIELFTELK